MTQLLVKTIADFSTTLTTKTAIGATTATLTTGLDSDGVQLPTGTYGFTVDRNSASKEHFTATLTGAALTNIQTVTRGTGVGTAGLLREHRKGAEVIITDHVSLKRMMNVLDGTTNLDSETPLGYDGTASISTANQLATKAYVDGVAVAGAPDASVTVKGVVEEATQAEVLSKTAAGDTSARLFVNPTTLASTLLSDYKVDTGTANAYVITPAPAITAYTTGQIFSFKAVNANTTTSTLNVNGLGVKTINKGSGATALASGDIAAGMVVLVEYDGTNFVMLNPVANAPLTPTGSGLELSNTTRLTRLASYTPAGNTTENTVYTTTIAGGLLSTNGMIKVRTPFNATTTATAETFTIRLKFGGSTLHTQTFSTGAVGGGTASRFSGIIEGWIINNASTNAQNHGMYCAGGFSLPSGPNPIAMEYVTSADSTSTVDTTSNQTLTMTVQRSNGSGASFVFSQTVVETIKNA